MMILPTADAASLPPLQMAMMFRSNLKISSSSSYEMMILLPTASAASLDPLLMAMNRHHVSFHVWQREH